MSRRLAFISEAIDLLRLVPWGGDDDIRVVRFAVRDSPVTASGSRSRDDLDPLPGR
jgi:hypothetical protein